MWILHSNKAKNKYIHYTPAHTKIGKFSKGAVQRNKIKWTKNHHTTIGKISKDAGQRNKMNWTMNHHTKIGKISKDAIQRNKMNKESSLHLNLRVKRPRSCVHSNNVDIWIN